MNVLVHQAALGDFVLSWPVVRGLLRLGPTAVVAPAGKAKLAAGAIAGVVPVDIEQPCWTAMHRHDESPSAPAGGTGLPFDLESVTRLVSFVSTGRDAWSANAARWFPHAQRLFVDPRPPAGWSGHVAEWHAAQLRDQGLMLDPVAVPRRDNPDGPVVIHPGSGGRHKCWPPERFEAVIRECIQQRFRGRLGVLLGEVELDTWPRETLDRWRRDYAAQPVTTLDALHDLLITARLYLGNDAGPTHLAAQLGVPTVALFGPTSPAAWKPLGPAVTVLAPPTPRPMDWLDPQTVRRRLDSCP